MSRYVWLVAVALVVVTAAILFWLDRSEEVSLPPLPAPRRDAGEWQPHPDRAGLPRRRHTE
jgi:hypothetical protein